MCTRTIVYKCTSACVQEQYVHQCMCSIINSPMHVCKSNTYTSASVLEKYMHQCMYTRIIHTL